MCYWGIFSASPQEKKKKVWICKYEYTVLMRLPLLLQHNQSHLFKYKNMESVNSVKAWEGKNVSVGEITERELRKGAVYWKKQSLV